jgi:hypothetical protein
MSADINQKQMHLMLVILPENDLCSFINIQYEAILLVITVTVDIEPQLTEQDYNGEHSQMIAQKYVQTYKIYLLL